MSAKCHKRTLEGYDVTADMAHKRKALAFADQRLLTRHCARGDGHAQGGRGHSKRDIGA